VTDTAVGARQAPGALHVRTVEVDDAAAAAVMPGGDWCWLAPSTGVAGWGTVLRVAVDDVDRDVALPDLVGRHVAPLRSSSDGGDIDAPPPVAFASLTFTPGTAGSVLAVPRLAVRRQDGRAWLTVVADAPIPDAHLTLPDVPEPRDTGRVRYAGTTAAEIAWLDAVDRAVRRLRAGEAEKVVLARDRLVYSDAPFDVPSLLRRLRARFPECYTFRVEGLIGASPELLVRRDGSRVASLVLAGTARRGVDAEDDRRIGVQLLHSAKDLAEHRPAVASVRSTLAPLCAHLDVDDAPHLLRLANVQHLATGVSGELHAEVDALSLAGRLHPTAAVGGTPTAAALALIAELETMDRGRYAGPVGWVDAAGDGELAIALRCAQLEGGRGRLFAGAGIVADSLPESELEETRLKLRAMQSAFGPAP
jgi:menaquinone-specific isochorismate synthase